MTEKLLTVNELAELYAVDRATVYRWIKAGMPYQEIGPSRRKRFSAAAVNEWNQQQGKPQHAGQTE